MKVLKQKVLERINKESGIYSFYLYSGAGDVLLDIESDYKYHAASLIKAPLMLEILRLWQEKAIDLDEIILLDEDEKVGGCGILPFFRAGHPLSVLELLKLMVCISDNTATNALIERFGIDGVNLTLEKIGATKTKLARKLMKIGTGTYSTACAKDMAKVMLALTEPGLLNAETVQWGKAILLEQQYNDRLSAYWVDCGSCGKRIGTLNRCPQCGTDAGDVDPRIIPFAHKTGEITGVVHDAGVLWVNEKAYALVGMSSSLTDNTTGYSVLRDVGSIILDFLKEGKL